METNRFIFTVGRLATIGCPVGKDQAFYWDTRQPGLGVRMTVAGSKAYVFQSKLRGKTIRRTIGDIAVWDIQQARSEARRLKQFVDQGRHPDEEVRALRVQAEARDHTTRREGATLRQAWLEYLEVIHSSRSARYYRDHLVLSQDGGLQHKVGPRVTIAGPLSALMSTRLVDLTPRLIASWLRKESETRKAGAAHAYRLLRAFAGWARTHDTYKGCIDQDIFRARDVREALPPSLAKAGDYLEREQLQLWFRAVLAIPNPIISAYLVSLLLTGARREEMGHLRWNDVDFQWKKMTIRDKVDGLRTIPLTTYVASKLASLPRVNEWVFSSTRATDGHIVEPRIAHRNALVAIGLPHVTLHGLRRSFGSLAEWTETPTGVVAQIMGHKPSALAEKHYRRRPLDLLRSWHEKLETWILAESGIGRIADAALRLQVPAETVKAEA